MITNPNVAYNYQKNPNLSNRNTQQSLAGLAIALRDNTNVNRNVTSIFPVNISTPNLGAGSPTMMVSAKPSGIGPNPYAGVQISGLGEIS